MRKPRNLEKRARRGEILAQKPRRPTEIALVWRSVSDWEISSKRNPCSRALVSWNRFQLSLPLWDTSVFVPESALRGVPFYEAIIGCAERCGKGGMKTLEGVFFEAESSARVSRRHFLGRLTWAHPVRCRAHAVTHVLSYACCWSSRDRVACDFGTREMREVLSFVGKARSALPLAVS